MIIAQQTIIVVNFIGPTFTVYSQTICILHSLNQNYEIYSGRIFQVKGLFNIICCVNLVKIIPTVI